LGWRIASSSHEAIRQEPPIPAGEMDRRGWLGYCASARVVDEG